MGRGGGSQPIGRPGVGPAFCQLLREAWGQEPGEAEGPEGETVARALAWFESMKSPKIRSSRQAQVSNVTLG